MAATASGHDPSISSFREYARKHAGVPGDHGRSYICVKCVRLIAKNLTRSAKSYLERASNQRSTPMYSPFIIVDKTMVATARPGRIFLVVGGLEFIDVKNLEKFIFLMFF